MTPGDVAAHLAEAIRRGFGVDVAPGRSVELRPSDCWAQSGALGLTGDSDGPPLVPAAPAAAVMAGAGLVLDSLHRGVVDDAAALLGERAALTGLRRQGRVSCGGAARLVEAGDGWLAVSLPRPDDWDLLPAWLGGPAKSWEDLERWTGEREAGALCSSATLLGLAVAAVPAAPPQAVPPPAAPPQAAPPPALSPWTVHHVEPASKLARRPLVVDLSGLWAGPLCADLLRRAGATVVKVEDPARPDGARLGPAAFFDLLNGGKRSAAVRFGSPELSAILSAADVIVSSARARAFQHAGIDPMAFLSAAPTVWIAITGYGWASNRVGFGDDAAAGAGLVAVHPDDGTPRFAADAIADPLCGTLAAVAALSALRAGGSWFVDASLSAAATFGGFGTTGPAVPWLDPAPPPRARAVESGSRVLGADTHAVMAGLP